MEFTSLEALSIGVAVGVGILLLWCGAGAIANRIVYHQWTRPKKEKSAAKVIWKVRRHSYGVWEQFPVIQTPPAPESLAKAVRMQKRACPHIIIQTCRACRTTRKAADADYCHNCGEKYPD